MSCFEPSLFLVVGLASEVCRAENASARTKLLVSATPVTSHDEEMHLHITYTCLHVCIICRHLYMR